MKASIAESKIRDAAAAAGLEVVSIRIDKEQMDAQIALPVVDVIVMAVGGEAATERKRPAFERNVWKAFGDKGIRIGFYGEAMVCDPLPKGQAMFELDCFERDFEA
jgi:hypothetical protein